MKLSLIWVKIQELYRLDTMELLGHQLAGLVSFLFKQHVAPIAGLFGSERFKQNHNSQLRFAGQWKPGAGNRLPAALPEAIVLLLSFCRAVRHSRSSSCSTNDLLHNSAPWPRAHQPAKLVLW
jgi:hypothetical protein